jgi:ArsR family transcriptional regulator
MKETEKVLKALANRRRLAIIKLLNENKKVMVSEISRHIKLSFKSTSKHLANLRNASLVDREQVGLEVFYSLAVPLTEITKSVISVL